jgi:hypothetical protein
VALDAINPTVAAVSLLLGLAGAAGYGLMHGRLVPAVTLKTLEAQWEARLAESHQREQDWKTAYERAEEARAVTSQQLGELMILARTTEALLRSLPPPPDRRPGE